MCSSYSNLCALDELYLRVGMTNLMEIIHAAHYLLIKFQFSIYNRLELSILELEINRGRQVLKLGHTITATKFLKKKTPFRICIIEF